MEELNINIMGEEDGRSQEKHWDKWVSPECSQILPPLAASVVYTTIDYSIPFLFH